MLPGQYRLLSRCPNICSSQVQRVLCSTTRTTVDLCVSGTSISFSKRQREIGSPRHTGLPNPSPHATHGKARCIACCSTVFRGRRACGSSGRWRRRHRQRLGARGSETQRGRQPLLTTAGVSDYHMLSEGWLRLESAGKQCKVDSTAVVVG